MTDRRITPANARVAHVSLKGRVEADRFTEGEPARVTRPVADLLARPDGARDRQILYGESVLVLDRHEGYAFIRADKDHYCGYVAEEALGEAREATHWVSAPATHLYPDPSIKSREVAALSHGSRLTITAEFPRFCETADGLFVPRPHVRAIGDWTDDPVGVAESLLGTPYLWGGNSRSGLDCSGLVQAALVAAGIACPGDSDLQREALGADLPPGEPYRRGDLFFWKGHVAIAVSSDRLIHANGLHMAVGYEDIDACIARIDDQGEGPLLAVKRL